MKVGLMAPQRLGGGHVSSSPSASRSRWTAVRFLIVCGAMRASSSASHITDGHPLNAVHYREYKILLRPERFTSPQSFRDFWKVARHTAKQLAVGATTSPEVDDNFVREVLFYDTTHFDLYNHAFILRKRTFYDNGWPRADHELVLKFRHADADVAAAVDVRPTIAGDAKIKFKEELLLLRHRARRHPQHVLTRR